MDGQMKQFYIGFEKAAALTGAQREKYVQELHQFNKDQTKPGRMIGGGARIVAIPASIGGGIGGAIGAGSTGRTGKERLTRGLVGALAGALGMGTIGGAIGGTVGGASALYQKKRGPGYLNKVTDKNLVRSTKASRKYTAGDAKAMNKAYWGEQIDAAKGEKNKQVFRDLLAKEK